MATSFRPCQDYKHYDAPQLRSARISKTSDSADDTTLHSARYSIRGNTNTTQEASKCIAPTPNAIQVKSDSRLEIVNRKLAMYDALVIPPARMVHGKSPKQGR